MEPEARPPQPHTERRPISGMWRRVASEGPAISAQTVPVFIYTDEATANLTPPQKLISTTS
jgi:hypothetical protein